jgi:hypothetical protein
MAAGEAQANNDVADNASRPMRHSNLWGLKLGMVISPRVYITLLWKV